MTIQEMRYEFKRKFEVIDSQQRKRLLGQEIDLILNEAELVFVKTIFTKSRQGLQAGQRDLSDIRTLIVPEYDAPIVNNTALLAQDNMFFLNAKVKATKTGCGTKNFRVYTEQHDDLHEEDYFTKSSFEWEEVNAELNRDGLLLYVTDFVVNNCYITYIKRPRRIYLATTPYRLPSGEVLSGVVSSELPEHTHPEIVDIAVTLAKINEEGSLPSRQVKQQLNNI